MCVHVGTSSGSLGGQRLEILGDGIIGSCKLPKVSTGRSLGLLQGQHVSKAEPSLQLHGFHFLET